jgi:hypothetical protein
MRPQVKHKKKTKKEEACAAESCPLAPDPFTFYRASYSLTRALTCFRKASIITTITITIMIMIMIITITIMIIITVIVNVIVIVTVIVIVIELNPNGSLCLGLLVRSDSLSDWSKGSRKTTEPTTETSEDENQIEFDPTLLLLLVTSKGSRTIRFSLIASFCCWSRALEKSDSV